MKFVVFIRIWHLFFSDLLSRIYYFLGSYTMFKTEFNSMENKTMQNHNIFWSQIFDFLLKIRASSQKKYRQIHMILVVPLSDKKSGETRKIKHQKSNDVTCSSLWFKKITGELNRKKKKIPNDEKSKWYYTVLVYFLRGLIFSWIVCNFWHRTQSKKSKKLQDQNNNVGIWKHHRVGKRSYSRFWKHWKQSDRDGSPTPSAHQAGDPELIVVTRVVTRGTP